jgi:hypothetical protein
MARLNRLIQPQIHDPYFVASKYQDPSVCTKCGLVFSAGIFEWRETPPEKAQKMVCPACRRIDDGYEGGQVLLEGDFLQGHKTDVINTLRRAEQGEKQQRPLERIMDMKVDGDRIEVRTTYEHLARRIGQAIHNAYKGDLKLQYSEGEKFLRVRWRRD